MSAGPAIESAAMPSTDFQENKEREMAISEYKQKVARHRYVFAGSR
jgi:hypothetical protein